MDHHNHENDIPNTAWRLGVLPALYNSDARVFALLQKKVSLDRQIQEARRAPGARTAYRRVQRQQAKSKTKTTLVTKICAKYKFDPEELQKSGPIEALVRTTADSLIYLAVLRRPTTKRKAAQ